MGENREEGKEIELMGNRSPAKVMARSIQQVCIVVNDLQKSMEAYWSILGVGPWAVFEFGAHKVLDLKYYGKPVWARYRGAVTQLGPIELELFETIEGPSVYQDWIDEHGEGLHHVKFLVEDLDIDRVNKAMEMMGFPSIMGGHFGVDFRNQFSYFDTRVPLKCILETSDRTGGKPMDATFYPEDPNAVSPARVKVAEVKQIGMVVKDAYETAKNYWNILGIGPWEIREWGSHVLYDRFYDGKPSWAKEKLAHAYIGDLELELCQPIEGDSVYQDWIDQHGEGLHHLKFLCEDVDGVSKLLTDQGFPSLQNAHFGDPKEKAGGFNYIYIQPLHCIWEPVHRGKGGLPVEPIARVP